MGKGPPKDIDISMKGKEVSIKWTEREEVEEGQKEGSTSGAGAAEVKQAKEIQKTLATAQTENLLG